MNLQNVAGVGIGLRIPHIQHVLQHKPAVPWFEVHICNFLRGGLNRALLQRVAQDYPLSFHGVSLNLGGADELNRDYLQRLKTAVDEFNPALISEHACFTALGEQHFHDLLPLPLTPEALAHLSERVERVQDFLGRSILIENVSRYTNYPQSQMTEAQFLAELSARSGCGILLDINNAYVNQCNVQESWSDLLTHLPLDAIGEVHLAGFSKIDGTLVDTHGQAVDDEVWRLYSEFVGLRPDVPCLIEWDNNLPNFARLQREAALARQIHDSAEACLSDFKRQQVN